MNQGLLQKIFGGLALALVAVGVAAGVIWFVTSREPIQIPEEPSAEEIAAAAETTPPPTKPAPAPEPTPEPEPTRPASTARPTASLELAPGAEMPTAPAPALQQSAQTEAPPAVAIEISPPSLPVAEATDTVPDATTPPVEATSSSSPARDLLADLMALPDATNTAPPAEPAAPAATVTIEVAALTTPAPAEVVTPIVSAAPAAAPVDIAAAVAAEDEPDLPKVSDATGRALVQGWLKAMGGEAKLRAVQRLRITGTRTTGARRINDVVIHWQWPNLFHFRETYQHLGQRHVKVIASDGNRLWSVVEQPERQAPRLLTPEEETGLWVWANTWRWLLEVPQSADMPPPVLQYFQEEAFGNVRQHGLKVFDAGKEQATIYFDSQTLLLARAVYRAPLANQPMLWDSVVTKLYNFDGLWLPEARDDSVQDGVVDRWAWSRTEVNPAFDGARFFTSPNFRVIDMNNLPQLVERAGPLTIYTPTTPAPAEPAP